MENGIAYTLERIAELERRVGEPEERLCTSSA
jgi:hypothetical protein